MSYCPTGKNRLWEDEVKMVCFTEEEPTVFKKNFKFGDYAIGFNKDKIISYGGNPAFYITENNENHAVSIARFSERISEKLKDKDLFENLDEEIINYDILESLLAIRGCFQEVRYKHRQDAISINSNQREWRIGYHLLKNKSVADNHPGSSCIEKENGKLVRYLNFTQKDVMCLIVPKDMKEDIRCLVSSLGSHVQIFEL